MKKPCPLPTSQDVSGPHTSRPFQSTPIPTSTPSSLSLALSVHLWQQRGLGNVRPWPAGGYVRPCPSRCPRLENENSIWEGLQGPYSRSFCHYCWGQKNQLALFFL